MMANQKNQQVSVELYRAYTVEEILDRREMFSKYSGSEELMYFFSSYD
jgi:hypothetical protein